MRNSSTLWAALLAGVLVLAGSGCDKLRARDNVNQGIAAYKSAKYNDAVEHFKQAIALDPDFSSARLYLATAYMVQWIPGAESPENVEFAKNARDQFMEVYKKDAKDKVAVASLASLAFSEGKAMPADEKNRDSRLARFNEAKDWYT